MKAFHCYSPPERQVKCAQLFASVTAYEVFYKVDVEDEKASGSEEVRLSRGISSKIYRLGQYISSQ